VAASSRADSSCVEARAFLFFYMVGHQDQLEAALSYYSRAYSPLWMRYTWRTERSRAGRRSGWTCGFEVEWSASRHDRRNDQEEMLTDFDMDMVGDRVRRDVVEGCSISSRYKEQGSLMY
jgi:hypothetical protein